MEARGSTQLTHERAVSGWSGDPAARRQRLGRGRHPRAPADLRLAPYAVPLPAVAAVMGHSDVRLTARYYVDLRVEDTRRAVEGVPEIDAAPPLTRKRAPGG